MSTELDSKNNEIEKISLERNNLNQELVQIESLNVQIKEFQRSIKDLTDEKASLDSKLAEQLKLVSSYEKDMAEIKSANLAKLKELKVENKNLKKEHETIKNENQTLKGNELNINRNLNFPLK